MTNASLLSWMQTKDQSLDLGQEAIICQILNDFGSVTINTVQRLTAQYYGFRLEKSSISRALNYLVKKEKIIILGDVIDINTGRQNTIYIGKT